MEGTLVGVLASALLADGFRLLLTTMGGGKLPTQRLPTSRSLATMANKQDYFLPFSMKEQSVQRELWQGFLLPLFVLVASGSY